MCGGVLEGVRTPDDFVVVDQVVGVLVGLVNQVDGDFFLGVCEGAEVAVLAGKGISSVGLAKLGLVAAGVVELFNFIVRLGASAVTLGTGDMGIGLEVGPAFVLIVVVVETDLALMRLCVGEELPLRGHGLVLKSAISKRKASPS